MKPKKELTYKKHQQNQPNANIKKKSIVEKRDNYNIISHDNKNKSLNEQEKKQINNANYVNIHQKKNKNSFISISDIPMSNEQILDNNNYLNIIQASILSCPNNNYENIHTVNANNYLNKENNSIISFNDLKLSILNKKICFNNPFVFSRNAIDLANPEKMEEEKNYQMRRYRYLKGYKYSFNEIRKKNSKIIQKWWKIQINPKIERRKKIIKIQSVYRGYITRKHLNDIICISVIYQNFINKLRKVFRNFVRRNYFPKRYYKEKYALEKIFPMKLKIFFRKWKKYKSYCEQKEDIIKNMIKIREKNRYILLILKAYFNIWKIKCEEINKNENNLKLLNNKDKKYLAVSKLFNKLEKIGNERGFGLSNNNLRKYLKYLENYYKFFWDRYKNLFQREIICTYTNSIINCGISKKSHFQFKKCFRPNYFLNDNYKNNSISIAKGEKNIIINKLERPSKNKISNRNVKKEKNKNIIMAFDKKQNKLFYNERIIPYLVRYLNKMRLKRLEIAYEYIYDYYKYNLFCYKANSWNKNQNLLMKKSLMCSLKFFVLKKNIIDYMQKSVIKKLTSFYLVIIKRRNALFILVHKMKLFKRINQLKKAMRFIRLWRLYLKLLKERALQWEIIEKSFSQTYEKLSDSIFVDKDNEKSIQTQMMTFMDKVNFGIENRKSIKPSSFESLYYLPPEKNNMVKININNNKFFQSYEMKKISLNRFYKENENHISNNSNDKEKKIKSSIFNKKDYK